MPPMTSRRPGARATTRSPAAWKSSRASGLGCSDGLEMYWSSKAWAFPGSSIAASSSRAPGKNRDTVAKPWAIVAAREGRRVRGDRSPLTRFHRSAAAPRPRTAQSTSLKCCFTMGISSAGTRRGSAGPWRRWRISKASSAVRMPRSPMACTIDCRPRARSSSRQAASSSPFFHISRSSAGVCHSAG
jgi:hypothetical protein